MRTDARRQNFAVACSQLSYSTLPSLILHPLFLSSYYLYLGVPHTDITKVDRYVNTIHRLQNLRSRGQVGSDNPV